MNDVILKDGDWITVSGYDYREEVRDLDLPSLKSPDIKDKWQKLSDKLNILVKSVIADLQGEKVEEGERWIWIDDGCHGG